MTVAREPAPEEEETRDPTESCCVYHGLWVLLGISGSGGHTSLPKCQCGCKVVLPTAQPSTFLLPCITWGYNAC